MTSLAPAPLPSLPGLLPGALATLLRRKPPARHDSDFAARFAIGSIDMAHVAQYRDFFDLRGSHVPLGYFYLLAQRAQLALMLDKRFPYPIPGLIHSRNELRQHMALQVGATLQIEVAASLLQEPGGVHKISFNVAFRQFALPVASCTSEYRTPRKNVRKPAGPTAPDTFPETYSPIDWPFEKSSIRRYAMVSGDYNPIHLSSLLARLFGYRGAIAHGMYSVGRAAAHIERQTSRPVTAISADFRRPILLPALTTFGLESLDATRGNYGVLLAAQKKLALSGAWET